MAEPQDHVGFQRLAAIDAVGVWTPRNELRVSVRPSQPRPCTPDDEAAWNAICAANPRSHDGEILAVRAVDFHAGIIVCERDRYKRLAVQRAAASQPAPGSADEVRILGVKGFITGRDASGGEHLFIGRRGSQTRVYPAMWESAPAGGVAVPRSHIAELSTRDLAESVEEEGREELGVDLDARDARVVAVCRDEFAGSDDVFLAFQLPGIIDPRRPPACQHGPGGWEYSDTAWLARADAPSFEQRGVIAPVRAVLRVMGWVARER